MVSGISRPVLHLGSAVKEVLCLPTLSPPTHLKGGHGGISLGLRMTRQKMAASVPDDILES